MTLKFVSELPRMPRGGRPEAPWRAELRKRPGEWAAVKSLGKTDGWGVYRNVPGFEFASRTVDGKRYLYARYVGVKGGKP